MGWGGGIWWGERGVRLTGRTGRWIGEKAFDFILGEGGGERISG